MNQEERRFDFHGLGAALKRAREEKGWTQAYVAELVDRDSRTIMNIENKGQYPSFDLFVKLITMFDVSVDQFIHADGGARSSSCRKHMAGKPVNIILPLVGEVLFQFQKFCVRKEYIFISAISGGGLPLTRSFCLALY